MITNHGIAPRLIESVYDEWRTFLKKAVRAHCLCCAAPPTNNTCVVLHGVPGIMHAYALILLPRCCGVGWCGRCCGVGGVGTGVLLCMPRPLLLCYDAQERNVLI